MKFSVGWVFGFLCICNWIFLGLPANAASDPLEQRGFTYGPLLFHPDGRFDTTYVDNVLRTREHPVDDFLLEYNAGFEMLYKPHKKVSLDINYHFGWHDYRMEEARDYLSHDASGLLTIRDAGLRGFNLICSTQYQQTGNSSPLETEVVAFSRFHNLKNYVAAEYQYNRLLIRGTYSYGFTDYFSGRNAGSDFNLHSGLEEIEYSLLPKRLAVYQNYSVARTLRWLDDSSDFDLHNAAVGVKGQYRKFTYNFSTGYGMAFALNQDDSSGGPAFTGTLGFKPNSRVSLNAGASRRFSAGVITGSSTDTSVFGSALIQLTRLGELNLTYSRSVNERVTGTVLTSSAYGANFRYRLNRFLTALAGYNRTDRGEEPGKGGFILNETHVGFSLRW